MVTSTVTKMIRQRQVSQISLGYIIYVNSLASKAIVDGLKVFRKQIELNRNNNEGGSISR